MLEEVVELGLLMETSDAELTPKAFDFGLGGPRDA